MDANQLTIKATPVFYAIRKALNEGWPVIVNEGSSRSGKTYSTIQNLIILANENPNTRITICSQSLPHIKRGAFRDFEGIMKGWGLWDDSHFSYTDFVYRFPNGSYIELFGLEDPAKAHGPGRDYLFINEANMVSKALFDQLAMRTTGQIILDLNPSEFQCWVYDVADNPRNKRIHSTYKNNLSNLSPNQIATIEAYKELPDDFMWKVYGLGLRGASKDIIYTHWKQCAELPGKGEVFYGLDFGYVNPCALVKVELYEGIFYVKELLYRSNMTITDVCAFIKGLDIGRSPVYCDAAEPKSIEELYRMGVNAKPAIKDVWAGILTVKSSHINVTADSRNLISEFQSYKWKLDKEGNPIEEPVKLSDHALDALRYAIHTHTRPKSQYYAV